MAALDALSTSELLQEPDQDLVDAVIDSLIEEPVDEIEEAAGDVEVIEIDNPHDNWDIEQAEIGKRLRCARDHAAAATRWESDLVMAKIVQVTPAQVNAAKLKIKRSLASGKLVPPSVRAVANARRLTRRSQPVPGS